MIRLGSLANIISTVLRIGLLSAAFPPDFDGIGDYTYWLANALAQSGIETSVWTSIGRQRVRL